MKVSEFEQRVWELERLRIVVRANRNEDVDDYDYKNAANENWRIGEFVKNRVAGRIDGRQVTVIQGDGKLAHGNTLLYALRESYSTE
jgi:pyruvate/2-oxoglutarate dehydrogenase complex dihydrolipoamide dehydrogenase (E3) component